MAKHARIAVAVVSLVAATSFLLCGIAFGHDVLAGPLLFYALAAFCAVLAVTCLCLRIWPLTMPILVGLPAVIVLMIKSGPNPSTSDLIVMSAVLGSVVLLWTGGYVVARRTILFFYQAAGLVRSGNIEGAVALLHQGLRRGRSGATTYADLAAFLAAQQNWKESLLVIEEAERLGAPNAPLLNTEGVVLWKLGRKAEALVCLEKSVHLQPDFIAVCNHGSLLAEMGELDKALESLRRAESILNTPGTLVGGAKKQVYKEALDEFRQKLSKSKDKAGK